MAHHHNLALVSALPIEKHRGTNILPGWFRLAVKVKAHSTVYDNGVADRIAGFTRPTPSWRYDGKAPAASLWMPGEGWRPAACVCAGQVHVSTSTFRLGYRDPHVPPATPRNKSE
eukprot:CAMPEP_0198705112 /NCGR_PEP_ID=MMETSP1468-20131203/390260_1 /TAXON_ID=1461545 /ORGANISM="Mantoniella sp, Strain CCMP1436" /LENGTH=114 /DNA_ID=CAMNT_0044463965 /DNA_START=754 /DNA_END=1098 /DNA_ORIENTATION=+